MRDIAKLGPKYGWVCATSFKWEIEGDIDGTTIYPTLKDLKAARSCCRDGFCTAYRLEIKAVERIAGKNSDVATRVI